MAAPKHDATQFRPGARPKGKRARSGRPAGNNASPAITVELTRELAVPIATTTYFMEAADEIARILEDQECVMHACEAETSMMMAAKAGLVQASRLPDAHGPAFEMVASLLPTLKRFTTFGRLTPSGVAGDARRATAAKGEALLDACARNFARRLQAGDPWDGAAAYLPQLHAASQPAAKLTLLVDNS